MTKKNKTYLFIGAAIAFYFWKKHQAAMIVPAIAAPAPGTLQPPPALNLNGLAGRY